MVSTDMICSMCGEVQTIYRYYKRQKRVGHIKDLWCPNCKKDRKFIEVKDIDNCYLSLLGKEDRTKNEDYILELLQRRKEIKNEEKRYFKHR